MSLMTPMPPAAPEPGPPPDDRRARYIAGLRVLADVLENNPDIPLPGGGYTHSMLIMFTGLVDQKTALSAAARAFPCTWRKSTSGNDGEYFDLHGEVEGLKLELTASRDAVCERVVTGTTVQDVEEIITPAVTRMVPTKVDVVEWRCSSLLAPRELTAEAPS